MGRKVMSVAFILVSGIVATLVAEAVNPRSTNYGDALAKSILYYEAQRSGPLPPSQRVSWRGSSALNDGRAQGVDLTGGYYDAGDNVKFGLPMAFTATMLAWSVVEYGSQMQSLGQLGHALDAIKWATDYFVKAHPSPNVLYGEVGDGDSDHSCWMRPEDMTTSRQAFKIDQNNPGSDLAGETAAALAAASIAFRNSNPAYSNLLLLHAKQLFTFADTYQGKYDNSIYVARNFYASRSGYADELLWAAMWLYKATGQVNYLKYVTDNAGALGGTSWGMKEFSWDVKYAGVQVLAAKISLEGKAGAFANVLKQYQQKAEYFLCAQLQGNYGGDNTDRTPGGLLYVRQWNNMQYVTASSFLLSVYADYLGGAGRVQCPSSSFSSAQLSDLAKSQVDYILGHNPRSTSYMVGFGANYPQQVHHRGASIISVKYDRALVACKVGYSVWYGRNAANPNVLVGALVGGPDENDNFADERTNFEQSEPATYNNGPLVGLLAKFAGHSSGKPTYGYPGGNTAKLPGVKPPAPVAKKPWKKAAPKSDASKYVAIRQRAEGQWQDKGVTYHRYVVVVLNKSRRTAKEVVVRMTGFRGQLWGMTKIGRGHNWVLPNMGSSLAPARWHEFVYVQQGPPAKITVAHLRL